MTEATLKVETKTDAADAAKSYMRHPVSSGELFNFELPAKFHDFAEVSYARMAKRATQYYATVFRAVETSIGNTVDLALDLNKAKSPSDVAAAYGSYTRKQLEAAFTQIEQLLTLEQQIATASAPLRMIGAMAAMTH